MNWKLKISDMLVIFVWLSFLLGTTSQLVNSSLLATSNFFAALCFCSIVLLGFKLKFRTGTTSSWILTGTLSLATSIIFFLVSSYVAVDWQIGLFAFISTLSIGISIVLLVCRIASGFQMSASNLTINRILELSAPSSCSALFFACFVAHALSNKLNSELFPLFIGSIIFLATGIFVTSFFFIEQAIKK